VFIAVPMAVAAQTPPKEAGTKSPPSGVQGTSVGKELFQQHCASCHYAETTAQKIGPGLKGLSARGTFTNGKKMTDAGLTKWIEDGGKNMPGLKDSIKSEEIRALISYIKTL
jgi:cytochrome c